MVCYLKKMSQDFKKQAGSEQPIFDYKGASRTRQPDIKSFPAI